ncbi:UNC5C-like protein isoform X1 [Cricetulus griseus]|uniref:UNC5C-like protein isoform X1 n=1 Tax=Cricetulus griseus TaxID=10029 RepID=UPI00022F66C6|nr:UNC5C-like protein isoform X1 [Cricetulus griseus]
MSPQESSVHPSQFLLLVGIPVASAFLLVQCLLWHCSRWLPGTCRKPDDQEESVSPPTPLPEYELPRQCPPQTLLEAAAFYQELHTPTRGQTITQQLMHKLLVYSAREVDHRGGCLMLHDTGISLFIPPGAVAVGRQERVSLVLVWDLTDAPSLSHRQGLVSPVVACDPHGASFLKPCTLTFKHCAQQPSQACAYNSNTSLLDAKDWRPLGRPKACISRDECRILLSHFSLYTCILEAPLGQTARKWLQLAVFCSPLAPGQTHLQLRVYFLNNTPCALQWAITNEQPHGGPKEKGPNTRPMIFPSSVVILKWKDVRWEAGSWENVDDSSSQLVPHLHIWHGKCPFRSFCFRRKAANENEDCSALTNEIIVTMHTFQDGLENKYMEILRFQASEEESWAAPPFVSQPPPCNRLPPELFEQLQMLLEPNSVTGNDWRRLASHLGLCGMKIRFLSCQRSPAAAILELFEEQNGSLQELHYLMTSMERLDCASAIQNYLNRTPRGSPAMMHGGAWENYSLELDEKL